MSFRPSRAEDVAAGIDTLRRELLALAAVRRPDAEQCHRLRVCCKRLRGTVRLLRQQGQAKRWQRCDHALRAVSRHYDKSRDARVLRDSIAELATRSRNTSLRRSCRQLLAALPPAAVATACNRGLREQLASQLRQFDDAGLSPARLNKGWRRSVARWRQLATPVLQGTADDAHLHRYRKWVKYLGYQLALAAAPDREISSARQALVRLGRCLGTVHDLALLEARLLRDPVITASGAATVVASSRRRRLALTRQAIRTSHTLFALLAQLG